MNNTVKTYQGVVAFAEQHEKKNVIIGITELKTLLQTIAALEKINADWQESFAALAAKYERMKDRRAVNNSPVDAGGDS